MSDKNLPPIDGEDDFHLADTEPHRPSNRTPVAVNQGKSTTFDLGIGETTQLEIAFPEGKTIAESERIIDHYTEILQYVATDFYKLGRKIVNITFTHTINAGNSEIFVILLEYINENRDTISNEYLLKTSSEIEENLVPDASRNPIARKIVAVLLEGFKKEPEIIEFLFRHQSKIADLPFQPWDVIAGVTHRGLYYSLSESLGQETTYDIMKTCAPVVAFEHSFVTLRRIGIIVQGLGLLLTDATNMKNTVHSGPFTLPENTILIDFADAFLIPDTIAAAEIVPRDEIPAFTNVPAFAPPGSWTPLTEGTVIKYTLVGQLLVALHHAGVIDIFNDKNGSDSDFYRLKEEILDLQTAVEAGTRNTEPREMILRRVLYDRLIFVTSLNQNPNAINLPLNYAEKLEQIARKIVELIGRSPSRFTIQDYTSGYVNDIFETMIKYLGGVQPSFVNRES